MNINIFPMVHLTSLIALSVTLWNYEDFGPDVWDDEYPLCAGYSQSPINIPTACTIYEPFETFHFTDDFHFLHNFSLVNNGHTILAKYTGSINASFILTGGGLRGIYEFINFHIHWGENYRSGSEHQINSKKYAGEIHFVYMNRQTHAIAVLGILIQSSRSSRIKRNQTINLDSYENNSTATDWQRYFSMAKTLRQTNNSTVISLNLTALMTTDLHEFWRYNGSLTMPPCTEGITWTIFKNPLVFTENELNSFRKNIYAKDYRGLQPLYNRTVYRSFQNETKLLVDDHRFCLKSVNNESRRPLKRNLLLFICFTTCLKKLFF